MRVTSFSSCVPKPCCNIPHTFFFQSSKFSKSLYSSQAMIHSSSVTSCPFPLRLLMIGAPGSGKGTQCSRIQEDFSISSISTGDLLRQEMSLETPLGLIMKEQMRNGGLVADDIVLELVRLKLRDGKFVKEGWILDGYPRTINQAEQLDVLLEDLKQPLHCVLYIDVDKNVIADRLKDRWIHPGSGRVYNLSYSPPKIPGKDDITGEPLEQREDDKPETVFARLNTFEEKTKPLLEYYQTKNLLHNIPSPNSDVGYKNTKKVIEKLLSDL